MLWCSKPPNSFQKWKFLKKFHKNHLSNFLKKVFSRKLRLKPRIPARLFQMKGHLSDFWSGSGKVFLLKFRTHSFFPGSIRARFDPVHALDINTLLSFTLVHAHMTKCAQKKTKYMRESLELVKGQILLKLTQEKNCN